MTVLYAYFSAKATQKQMHLILKTTARNRAVKGPTFDRRALSSMGRARRTVSLTDIPLQKRIGIYINRDA